MVKSEISGTLSRKDIKKLTGVTRSGTVGPTTVYYAGVTAPIISAGIAVFIRNLLNQADYITHYWLWLISAFISAFAGISWYLIFMRWSYRSSHGRGDEVTAETKLEITDDALIVNRSRVKTIIDWEAILEITQKPKYIALHVQSSDTILIPDHWFSGDTSARDAFHTAIKDAVQNRKPS